MDWFLCDKDLQHEKIKLVFLLLWFFYSCLLLFFNLVSHSPADSTTFLLSPFLYQFFFKNSLKLYNCSYWSFYNALWKFWYQVTKLTALAAIFPRKVSILSVLHFLPYNLTKPYCKEIFEIWEYQNFIENYDFTKHMISPNWFKKWAKT